MTLPQRLNPYGDVEPTTWLRVLGRVWPVRRVPGPLVRNGVTTALLLDQDNQQLLLSADLPDEFVGEFLLEVDLDQAAIDGLNDAILKGTRL